MYMASPIEAKFEKGCGRMRLGGWCPHSHSLLLDSRRLDVLSSGSYSGLASAQYRLPCVVFCEWHVSSPTLPSVPFLDCCWRTPCDLSGSHGTALQSQCTRRML